MKKLIETYSYHLEVDTEAEIRKNTKTLKEGLNGDWYWCSIYNTIGRTGDITPYDFKITAHRPKDYAPILEGVLLMGDVKNKITPSDTAVRLLRRYKDEMCGLQRSTSDLSPLEEWLIIQIHAMESPSEDDEVERPTFFEELQRLINRHSVENRSNTPDFILAKYMFSSLINLEDACKAREEWYDKKTNIGYKADQQSEKKYSKDDIMTWYQYVKTHTVEEAFNYLQSLNKTK